MWFALDLCFFFFNDTATTEIYTLSLHDALPILHALQPACTGMAPQRIKEEFGEDRKSTRLNSSHGYISYAVFCLKKTTQVTKRPSGAYGSWAGAHVERQRRPA